MAEKSEVKQKKSAAKKPAAKAAKKVTKTASTAKKAASKKVAAPKAAKAKKSSTKSNALQKAEQYAIIATGGKQYAVTVGDTLDIEKLAVEAGSDYTFTDVLLVGEKGEIKTGRPFVEGAKVVAKVMAHDRDAKVIAFKKKRRKGFQKKIGHRQHFSRVEITGIQL